MDQTKFFRKIYWNAIKSITNIEDCISFIDSVYGYCRYFPAEFNEYITDKEDEYLKIKSEATQSSGHVRSSYIKKEDISTLVDMVSSVYPDVYEPFEISKNINYIGDLLELNDVEKLILQFYFFLGAAGNSDQNIVEALDNINSTKSEFFHALFGIPEKASKEIFSLSTNLLTCGLLEPSGKPKLRNHYSIIQPIQELLILEDLDDTVVEKKLFPNILSTELELADYYQTEEIEILSNILTNTIGSHHEGINILLWGLPGTGKTELPVLLAQKHGWDLVSVGDVGNIRDEEKGRSGRLLNLKIAQKLFKNRENKKYFLLFDEMDDLFRSNEDDDSSKAFINRIIEKSTLPIIWTTNDLDIMDQASLRRMTYSIEFKVPPAKIRKQIWKKYDAKYGLNLDPEIFDDLSVNYDVVPALISNAAKVAKLGGVQNHLIGNIVSNLDTTMNFGYSRHLGSIKKTDSLNFQPLFVNSDIPLITLTERLTASRKKNFSLCLYGPPGTGKSAYARHLAKQLGVKVLFKKASDLMSMWLGQTEKNIAAAFKEARDDESLLVIDEADTFLSSRSNTSRSYEVSQVNEMLTQMENHNGPFVCTTNLMDILDEASLRRFTFKIKFNAMKANQVSEIFKYYFNGDCPTFLKKYDILTPGDFANVKKQVEILEITDMNEIANLLVEECKMKPQYIKQVGF